MPTRPVSPAGGERTCSRCLGWLWVRREPAGVAGHGVLADERALNQEDSRAEGTEAYEWNNGTMPAGGAGRSFVTLLVATGLGAAVLRGPATIQGAEALPDADKDVSKPALPMTKTMKAEPFDLSYLSPNAVGFLASSPRPSLVCPPARLSSKSSTN